MDLIWKKYLINVRENRMAIKNEQSRETGNIGYTRHRTLDKMSNQEWTIQRNWQHWVHKTQDVRQKKRSRMDNLEKLATLGTQDTGRQIEEAIKNGQSRETGNIGYTRHRTLDRMSNQEWTIQRDWQHWVHKTHDEDTLNVTYIVNMCWTPLYTSKHK